MDGAGLMVDSWVGRRYRYRPELTNLALVHIDSDLSYLMNVMSTEIHQEVTRLSFRRQPLLAKVSIGFRRRVRAIVSGLITVVKRGLSGMRLPDNVRCVTSCTLWERRMCSDDGAARTPHPNKGRIESHDHNAPSKFWNKKYIEFDE